MKFACITERAMHSQVHKDLLCPLSGQVEPMKLQLYEVEKKHLFYHRIYRVPSAKFFQVEGEREIAPSYWTSEMNAAYKTALKSGTPVANRHFTVTLMGKVCAVLTLVLLFILGGLIAKHYWFDLPRQERLESQILSLPKVDDYYYVAVEDLQHEGQTPLRAYSWAKVIEVYEADSTVHLQLSNETRPLELGREGHSTEATNFGGYIYTTKFSPTRKPLGITFAVIGRNATIKVDSITQLEGIKIPASH